MNTYSKALAMPFLLLFCYTLAHSQTQTVRLKEVPLVEDIEGEKKKFKFDFRDFIPDNSETKIYLVSRFCHKGQNFIVRKTVSSPKFTFTVKYYVDQFLDERPIFAASKINSL